MRMRFGAFIAAGCFLSSLILPEVSYAQSSALTNDSIKQMVQWKASAKEIVSVIKRNASNTKFILSAETIMNLTESGVSKKVLDAMWKASRGSSKQPPLTSIPSPPTREAAPGSTTQTPPPTQAEAATAATNENAAVTPAPTSPNTNKGVAETQPTIQTPLPIQAETAKPATASNSSGAAVQTKSTAPTTPTTQAKTTTPSLEQDVQALSTQVKSIQSALATEDSDFALVLGLGSLVVNHGVTDYQNQSNVIHATNLGRATPQLLTGVAFRSKIQNLVARYRRMDLCNAGSQRQVPPCAELWQKRPWSAFVSLKIAPGASQLINGYVIGGTFSIAPHLDALVGFALSPINEPAPGFRVTASQFVSNQQKLGQLLNFDPNAMLSGSPDAFDGFPVTDSIGKLIYPGDPLTVHYRGSMVFGVSFPIYFRSFWKSAGN
jgi:hypothetical protein